MIRGRLAVAAIVCAGAIAAAPGAAKARVVEESAGCAGARAECVPYEFGLRFQERDGFLPGSFLFTRPRSVQR